MQCYVLSILILINYIIKYMLYVVPISCVLVCQADVFVTRGKCVMFPRAESRDVISIKHDV